MRLVRLLLTFFILALFASRAGSGTDTIQWYSGTIHPHSTFSDGGRTPTMLKNAAAKRSLFFMIVDDHNYQIPTREKLTGKITDDYGYDKYFRDFSTANSPKVRGTNRNLVCVAGAEVNAGRAHLLILEKLPTSLDLHPGQSQEEVISILTQNHILFGIAHPHNKDYPFDFGGQGADQARGFEIYNDDYARTFEAYCKSEAPGKFIFTGTDSHTSLDATDLARWAHITQVWVRGPLTDESLIAALRNGQTAATNYGAYIKRLSSLPQCDLQEVEEARFDLTMGFGLPILKAKKVKVYRDKELCPESIISIPIGTTEFHYQWKDTRVSAGVHEYFLVVDDKCLVTSPINLKINRPAAIEVSPTVDYLDNSWIDYQGTFVKGFPKAWANSNQYKRGARSSPDGQSVIYSTGSLLGGQIYLIEPEKGHRKKLSDGRSNDSYPCWSPDGKNIVFRSEIEEKFITQIEIINADGTNRRILVRWEKGGLKVFDPLVDWRGGRIVYIGLNSRGRYELWVVSPDGRNESKLFERDDLSLRHPSLSLDGKKVVFHSEKFHPQTVCTLDIWVADVDGGSCRQLTHDGKSGSPYFMSGNKIVYEYYPRGFLNGKPEIWMMNDDGSNQRRIK